MAITISVLIPAKGDPMKVVHTIFNLESMAAHPESVEYIVVIDNDEPHWSLFASSLSLLTDLWLSVTLLKSPGSGYLQIPAMYQQAYLKSKGSLLFLYNDDARVLTYGWDDAYRIALDPVPFGVACAHCDEGEITLGSGVGRYPWAFPVLRRDLCLAIGNKICFGDELDRVIDAYSGKTGKGVFAPVSIKHNRAPLVAGTARAERYAHTEANWPAMLALWDSEAQRMQDLVHLAER